MNLTLDSSKNPIDQIEDIPFQEFKTMYKQVFIKVLSNIKYNKNSAFVCSKIIDKEWSPKDIPRMHREELFPERWDSLYKDRTEHLNKKKKKGMHRCPKCKSWYTDYTQLQTRSSDEPMSTFVTCIDCDYRWKYG